MDNGASEKPIVGYRALADFLNSEGYRTSASTLSKYCSPAINTGPEKSGYFGIFPTFLPSVVLSWARTRGRAGRHADTTA
jgi:hypothetical protein